MIQIVKKSPAGQAQKKRYPDVTLSELKTCAERLRSLSAMADGLVASASDLGIDRFDKISGGARLSKATESLEEVFGELSGKVSIANMRRGRMS